MKLVTGTLILLSSMLMGKTVSAEDISFRDFSNMRNFEKDLTKRALEDGLLASNSSLESIELDLDGITRGSKEDIELFIRLLINDICPTCSTTSSGSTVKVKYGRSSSGGKRAYVLNSDDYNDARYIESKCRDLLYYHRSELDGKDILIVDNNDDEDKIALCFNRD